MNILVVGNLNVNPERFLVFTENHKVYGILESNSLWKISVKPPVAYEEIETISLDEIGSKHIDIVWSLLSPWDGLEVTSKIMLEYPDIPVIRQSQGGITPFFHSSKDKIRDRLSVRGLSYTFLRGANYIFDDFKRLIESCDGIMVNAEKYRWCLLEQGVNIGEIPYLITNGMAYDDRLCKGKNSNKLSEKDGIAHLSVIGRLVGEWRKILEIGAHFHLHSNNKIGDENSCFFHIEKYIGDIDKFVGVVSLKEFLNYKISTWYDTFSVYDLGLMHIDYIEDKKEYGADVFNGIDINVPGRVNTYIMSDIVPVLYNNNSAMKDFLGKYGFALLYNDYDDLKKKVNDLSYIKTLRDRLKRVKHKFSMQYEYDRIIDFFEKVIENKKRENRTNNNGAFAWFEKIEFVSDIVNGLSQKIVYEFFCKDCCFNLSLKEKVYIGYDKERSNKSEMFTVDFCKLNELSFFSYGGKLDRVAVVLNLDDYIKENDILDVFLTFIARNFKWFVFCSSESVDTMLRILTNYFSFSKIYNKSVNSITLEYVYILESLR